MIARRVSSLHPYKPGEQPTDREYIKLNANENPYPPAPEVIKAITDLAHNHAEKMALYPDPDSVLLREAIASMLNTTGGLLWQDATSAETAECSSAWETVAGKNAALQSPALDITPDMIFCGNGSDEVLSFVFYSFFDSDSPLIMPEHTYSFYPVYAGYYNIPYKKIPLKDDYSLDLIKICTEAQLSNSSCIFANPNAPTGLSASLEDINNFLTAAPKNKVHVIDEAYGDFGNVSALSLIKDNPNLLVVRTFSKSLSFAGMRLGFAVGQSALIETLHRVKDSFNHFPVDVLTQTGGIAACKAVDYYRDKTRKILEERENFSVFLKNRGWFVLPSQTNFVFAKKDSLKGKVAYEALKTKGILVRRFDIPGIEDFLRISIGTKEDMNALKQAFEECNL